MFRYANKKEHNERKSFPTEKAQRGSGKSSKLLENEGSPLLDDLDTYID